MFRMRDKKYYITTPIYYVNDAPHIGSAYTTITADVLARFKRLDGYDVFFLTGTDEYGQKIEKSAREADMAPLDFVNKVSQHFRDLYPVIDATPDVFMRTTEPRHHQAAQALWQRIEDKGDIYQSTYAGWYAVRDEAFYGEKELIDGHAPSGAAVEWVEEPSHFFRLSKWQQPLLEFYRTHPDFISPESRRNEVIRFVEGGLHDLSISRSTFNWGIPVPLNNKDAQISDQKSIMYVWLEALTIYLTALGYPDNFDQDAQEFWSESLHLMGKDILRFHAVYWPAFLMSAGLKPPKKVFAHGWWTNQGAKISKSLKNTIDPIALIEKYGSDQIRYYLCREVPFGQDGEFSEAALLQRINSDLANDFGNLSQRVLSFIQKNAEGNVPKPEDYIDKDRGMLDLCQNTVHEVRKHVNSQALSKMCESIWALVAEGNRYIDGQQPWALKKSDPLRMNTVLYILAETLRHIAILSQAIIPKAASKLLEQLAVTEDQRALWHLENLKLIPGTPLPVPEGLFPRFQIV